MDIASISQLLTNRINALSDARIRSLAIGDLDQINMIDKDLMETKNTLQQLVLITNVATAAASANKTTTEVVNSGINAINNTNQTPSVQGPSASAIINGYDISAYATDPLYEQKIQNIVNAMSSFDSVDSIDNYIQNINPGSPVSGEMVMKALTLYPVDTTLLLAIMQNDSSFGTAGVGARTFNPGNVGNNGISEKTYPSWASGVEAVAAWLNDHRSL